MAGVVWHKVSLNGFGVHRGQVTYTFPAGFGVLIAPNEAGKSTLLAGLLAVLYGLSNQSDVAKFSQARFRPLDGNGAFSGQVEFTATDGARYLVQRKFETHSVEVISLGAAVVKKVLSGTHNPGARHSNQEYENLIEKLTGIRSYELQRATFCVTQPLPEMNELDDALQRLLAGAGGGAPQQALKLLFEDLKELTRNTGQYGLAGKRNQNLPRKLENIQEQIDELSGRLTSSRTAVDALQKTANELAAATVEEAELRKASVQSKEVLGAWQKWQGLAQRRQFELKRLGERNKALEGCLRIEGEMAAAKGRLQSEWPELEGAPAETEARLQELGEIERQGRSIEQQIIKLNEQLTQTEQLAIAAEDRLGTEFNDVADRPRLIYDLQELQKMLAELESEGKALAGLNDAEAGLKAALAAGPKWERIDAPALGTVRRLRGAAEAALRQWQRYGQLAKGIADLEAAQRPLTIFSDQSPQVLGLIREAPTRRAGLQGRLDVAKANVDHTKARQDRLESTAAELQKEFEDVAGADAEIVRAAGEKMELLARQEHLQSRLQAASGRPASSGVWILIAALVGAGLGFGAGWLIKGLLPGNIGMAAPVVLALAGVVLGMMLTRATAAGKSDYRQARAEADELAGQIAEVNQRLGGWASVGSLDLNARVQRHQQWQQRSQAVALELQELAAAPDTLNWQEQMATAQRQLGELEAELRPFTEQFKEPDLALAQWQEQNAELQRLRSELIRLESDEWGVALTPETPLAAITGRWSDLAVLAEVCAEAGLRATRPSGVAELADWLAGSSAEFWEQAIAMAEKYDSEIGKLHEVQREREQILRPDPAGFTSFEHRQGRIADLRRQVQPFTEVSDPVVVADRLKEAEHLKGEAGKQRAALLALRRQRDSIDEHLAAETEKMRIIQNALAAVLAPVGGDVMAALERWQNRAQVRQQFAALETELRGMLAAADAADLPSLEQKAAAARYAAEAVDRALQELSLQYVGLPALADADEALVLHSKMKQLEEQQGHIDQKLTLIEDKRRDLREKLHDLTRDTVNVAAAETRLADLQSQRQQVSAEAKAVALAHRELEAAMIDYHDTYRDRLAFAATGHWQRMTGRTDRRVAFDDKFAVSVLGADASELAPSQLSKGAQDQLYLALRLSFADLVAADIRLPFVFDDPFLNCDETRLGYIRTTLEQLATDRQVLLFSHRREFATWGQPITSNPAGPKTGN